MPNKLTAIALGAAMSLAGCAATGRPPIPTVRQVDLARYMGAWYVIASIPTYLEKGIFNAVETYSLNPDGTVAVDFTYHKGSFDAPATTLRPRGFIAASSNAVWGVRVIWPLKSEYLIAYLNDAYTEVIVARSARDHVWIMARTPEISAREYQNLVALVAGMGYDTAKLEKVPQRWP